MTSQGGHTATEPCLEKDNAAADKTTLALVAYLCRRAWAPLDVALLAPRAIQSLGVAHMGRVFVDIVGVQLSLIAFPDANTGDGDVQLPAWLGALFGGPCDGAMAEVRAADAATELASRGVDLDQQVALPLQIEGPLLANAGDSQSTSVFVLARPHLRPALLRQLSRAGVRRSQGAAFAARISGHVCIFRLASGQTLEGDEDAKTVADPAAFCIRQALPHPGERKMTSGKVAALACAKALREVGAFGPSVASATRLLCQGMPPVSGMPGLLWCLREELRAQGITGVIHLPLCQLVWELPAGGSAAKTLSALLRGFIHNMLPPGGLGENSTASKTLLVLWGLDCPLPTGAAKWLETALLSLKTLPSRILGLCSSRAKVPKSIHQFFGTDDPLIPVPDLGLAEQAAEKAQSSVSKEGIPALVGRDDVLSELRASAVSYYIHADLFKSMGITWPPRVLIHGPAGAGKTLAVRWVCAQLPASVRQCWVQPGDVWSRYLGESESRLRKAFAEAADGASKKGAVLVLEGLDQLAPRSGSSSEGVGGFRERLVATLLTCLDGIDSPGAGGSSSSGVGLGVIATSSTPAQMLDARVTRPGRMDRWIEIQPPGPEQRISILQHYMMSGRSRSRLAEFEASSLSMNAALEPGIKKAVLTASEGATAGALRLAAERAWDAARSRGLSAPLWEDVLTVLGGNSSMSASLHKPVEPTPAVGAERAKLVQGHFSSSACSYKPKDPTPAVRAERAPRPELPVPLPPDVASEMAAELAAAAMVPIPSSDDDD